MRSRVSLGTLLFALPLPFDLADRTCVIFKDIKSDRLFHALCDLQNILALNILYLSSSKSNIMKNLILLLLIISSACFKANGQGMEKLIKFDSAGVVVSYNWSPSVKKDPESPRQLCLELTNANDYPVKMTFTLQYLIDKEVFEEGISQTYCIKPGKTLKGKKYGLCWTSNEISNSEMDTPSFSWDIGERKLEKAEACE